MPILLLDFTSVNMTGVGEQLVTMSGLEPAIESLTADLSSRQPPVKKTLMSALI